MENRRKQFDYIAVRLGYTNYEDWYGVTTADIRKFGGKIHDIYMQYTSKHKIGGTVLHYYSSSPSSALLDIYPEHDWKLWKFGRSYKPVWNDVSDI